MRTLPSYTVCQRMSDHDDTDLTDLDRRARELDELALREIEDAHKRSRDKLREIAEQEASALDDLKRSRREEVENQVLAMVDKRNNDIMKRATGDVDTYNELIDMCGVRGWELIAPSSVSPGCVTKGEWEDAKHNVEGVGNGEFAVFTTCMYYADSIDGLPKVLCVLNDDNQRVQCPVPIVADLLDFYKPSPDTSAHHHNRRLFTNGTLTGTQLTAFVEHCTKQGTWPFKSPTLSFTHPPDVPGFVPGRPNLVLVESPSGIPCPRPTLPGGGMLIRPPIDSHFGEWQKWDVFAYAQKLIANAPSDELAKDQIRLLVADIHQKDNDFMENTLAMMMHQGTKEGMIEAIGNIGENPDRDTDTQHLRDNADEIAPARYALSGWCRQARDPTQCVQHTVMPHDLVAPFTEAHGAALKLLVNWVSDELTLKEKYREETDGVKLRPGDPVTEFNVFNALSAIRANPALVDGGYSNPLTKNPARYCAVHPAHVSE